MFLANSPFDRLSVAGINFDFIPQGHILDILQNWRITGKRTYLAVTNPHSVMLCRRDPDMRHATAHATLTLPDGVGIILAAKLLGYGRRHRCTGPALMLEICDRGRELNFRHFFLGGAQGIPEKLAHRLQSRFPGLHVCGTLSPPFRHLSDDEDNQLVRYINSTKPDILWIGLGAPKQEIWMANHFGRIHAPVMIGVGAAFDFHSGNLSWAPGWVRRFGIEWAYRLLREPRRMWRRNLDSPLFLLHVLAQSLRSRLYSFLHRQPTPQQNPSPNLQLYLPQSRTTHSPRRPVPDP